MELLNTIHKRKSATITTIIMILILLLIFFFGLKYMDPPIETGITVNFGTSNVGSGVVQPKTPVKTKITPEIVKEEKVEEITEKVEEKIEEQEAVPEDNTPVEDVVTQEMEESIRLKELEKEKKRIEEVEEKARLKLETEAKAKAEAEKKAKAEAAKIQKVEDDKRKALDALMGGLNNNDGNQSGGEGDDAVAGDKGKVTGDPNASGYYGNGGKGGNGDYQLGNRKPLNRPKPDYECEEEGLVVVTIEVNRAGKVIKATPGAKGSTNNAACLLSQAKIAALKTTWEPDSKAGIKQIGIIKYRFSLTN